MDIYKVVVSTFNDEFEADEENKTYAKCIKVGDKFINLDNGIFYELSENRLDYEPNKMYAFGFEELFIEDALEEFEYYEKAMKIMKKYKKHQLEELYAYVEPQTIEYNDGLYYAFISKAVVVELDEESDSYIYDFDDVDIYENIGIVRDGKFYNLDNNKFYDIVDARGDVIIKQDDVNIQVNKLYALQLDPVDSKKFTDYLEYKKCAMQFNKDDFEDSNEKSKVIKFPKKR